MVLRNHGQIIYSIIIKSARIPCSLFTLMTTSLSGCLSNLNIFEWCRFACTVSPPFHTPVRPPVLKSSCPSSGRLPLPISRCTFFSFLFNSCIWWEILARRYELQPGQEWTVSGNGTWRTFITKVRAVKERQWSVWDGNGRTIPGCYCKGTVMLPQRQ